MEEINKVLNSFNKEIENTIISEWIQFDKFKTFYDLKLYIKKEIIII